MKRQYSEPDYRILCMSVEDVIRTSPSDGGDNTDPYSVDSDDIAALK